MADAVDLHWVISAKLRKSSHRQLPHASFCSVHRGKTSVVSALTHLAEEQMLVNKDYMAIMCAKNYWYWVRFVGVVWKCNVTAYRGSSFFSHCRSRLNNHLQLRTRKTSPSVKNKHRATVLTVGRLSPEKFVRWTFTRLLYITSPTYGERQTFPSLIGRADHTPTMSLHHHYLSNYWRSVAEAAQLICPASVVVGSSGPSARK